ncbi:MAG: hypothetical protein NWE99_07355 [Candidatus Bathyarchaeota archaeon]|nr:hypothetical protein [Candidatus Bathyarchaeota archaeon]
MRIRADSHKTSAGKRSDLISALEEVEKNEKFHLKIQVPRETAEQAFRFLKEKGLPSRQGLALVVVYGLSDETAEELEKLRIERESVLGSLGKDYATSRFRAHELYEENSVLTRILRFMLKENRSLKKSLKKKGLGSCVPKDEWDNWSEATVDDYYQTYVFRSQQ